MKMKKASLVHFCNAVDRIQKNSWWAANFSPGMPGLAGFTFSIDGDKASITDVPTEALESLLLHVRKFTSAESPENLLKIRKALKGMATGDEKKEILEAWHKYWKIAFIKEPFQFDIGGVKQIMTPYRVYDCFINGLLFHTDDPTYNVILHGNEQPLTISDPSLFLRNIFHSTVTNFCFAAMGLKFYIENMNSMKFILTGYPPTAFEFILCRKKIDEMDEQYKIFNDWIDENGGCPHGRWGN